MKSICGPFTRFLCLVFDHADIYSRKFVVLLISFLLIAEKEESSQCLVYLNESQGLGMTASESTKEGMQDLRSGENQVIATMSNTPSKQVLKVRILSAQRISLNTLNCNTHYVDRHGWYTKLHSTALFQLFASE